MRGVGRKAHPAHGGLDPYHLQSLRVSADTVDRYATGDLVILAVESHPPGENGLYRLADMIAREGFAKTSSHMQGPVA